nr:N-acetylmuramoyl-L-alanine amidase [Actinomycetota bacterium]
MGLQRVQLLAATALAACVTAPVGNASTELRPPVTWLKGEGNFTKAHRSPESLESIVVHVTEGAFWGSVQWLKNPRAHASSHFIVSRGGKIIQLVHVSDIAWHAGNWNVNRRSVGIEHEGFTYGPAGFTDAQYGVRLSVVTRLRPGPLAGIVPWRAKTTGGVRSVEFVLDGRVVWTDRRAPFTFAGGHGLNTTRLGNGAHVLELRAYGDGTRHDVTSRTVVVDNRAFRLTTAGAREWTRVRGTVRLRVHAWGAEAKRVV